MNEKKHKNIFPRVLIVVVAVLLVLCGVGYGAGSYMVNYALSPASSSDERNVEGAVSYIFDSEEEENAIGEAYSATTSKVSITSNDGLTLYGYTTREEDSHLWAIVIHGYKRNAQRMMNYGARYAENGYNVLLPDNRAHGESEGKYIGMGWLDKDDIELWIDWIIAQDADAQIILHGLSMGAATVMMVSGDNPANVMGYVEDCGYTTVWDILASELGKRFSLPEFPIMNIANVLANMKAGYDWKEASAVDQVAKCKKPMLFIHGVEDDFVPVEMGYEVYDAAGCEKELYLVEGAGHAQSELKDPDAYWEEVFSFIDEYCRN